MAKSIGLNTARHGVPADPCRSTAIAERLEQPAEIEMRLAEIGI